jgi:4-hydroxy-tetrahydrodipicolinate synthase
MAERKSGFTCGTSGAMVRTGFPVAPRRRISITCSGTSLRLLAHFRAVAAETDRPIVVYNIPYRTGVNLENAALLRLVKSCPNVKAVKDSSGSLTQTLDLLEWAPEGFSVLTGEDALFFTALANGADGGILAVAHLATTAFVQVAGAISAGDLPTARQVW